VCMFFRIIILMTSSSVYNNLPCLCCYWFKVFNRLSFSVHLHKTPFLIPLLSVYVHP
jgi:hypothetical protein